MGWFSFDFSLYSKPRQGLLNNPLIKEYFNENQFYDDYEIVA
jgi:hypothetical protein